MPLHLVNHSMRPIVIDNQTLQGALRRAQSDDELLAEAEKTFDLLYEAYFEAPKR